MLLRNLLIELLHRNTLAVLGVFFAFVLLGITGLWLLFKTHPNTNTKPVDLGQGIISASALRGHLTVRWNDKLQYKLKIEPLDPRYATAFAYVMAHPPRPYSLEMRLLDSSGFPLCTKEVLFAYNPVQLAATEPKPVRTRGRTKAQIEAEQAKRDAELNQLREQERQREHGKDVLLNERDEDGKVIAATSDGIIPCTAEQFRRVYYWDFSSTFPTASEQNAIMEAPAIAAARRRAARLAAERRRRSQIHALSYFAQGDEVVNSFDADRGVLQSVGGNAFFIPNKGSQGIASFWAANSTLVHYKCDQHGNCTLTSAGGRVAIHGQLYE